jgi:hypothetical protein
MVRDYEDQNDLLDDLTPVRRRRLKSSIAMPTTRRIGLPTNTRSYAKRASPTETPATR